MIESEITYMDLEDGEKLLLRQYDLCGEIDAEILMDRKVALELAGVIIEMMGEND